MECVRSELNNSSPVEVSSPEPDYVGEVLGDYQLATLIGGIGNNEGKSLLIVAMASRGGAYMPRSLHKLILGLPGMDGIDAGGIYTQKSWCRHSIEPTGLVHNNGAEGTRLTSLGARLGVPLAGLLLDHADKFDTPLVELFGETRSSSEVPSQFIRLRIIEELLTSPAGIQLSDFVGSSEASNQVVIEKQLRKLANAGLIAYNDWDSATSQTRYRVRPESRDSLAAKSGFAGTIAAHLLHNPVTTHDQVIKHCTQTVPGFDKLSPRTQSAKVSAAMFDLKRRELIQKLEGRERPSELDVSLTPEQLEQWSELCNKLEAFKSQRPETLTKWSEAAYDFITDPAKVRNAYERSRYSSARANPTEKNLGSIVLKVLQEIDGPASVREVVKQASNIRGSSVSHFGVVTILNKLTEKGLAIRQHDKVLMFSKR